jgi:hypothetical protein
VRYFSVVQTKPQKVNWKKVVWTGYDISQNPHV